ncbi:MAG: hypothetical protein C0504_13005 [Candidatus Solibacter sp.]|nr:hypothetical protein [Candidatus Solibacter sp.]
MPRGVAKDARIVNGRDTEMRKQPALWLAVVAAVLLTGCEIDPSDWGDSTRYREEFTYSYKLTAGGRVSLESFNGGAEIIGWDRDMVEVTGSKYAARRDVMEQIKIDAISEPGYLRVRAIKPIERNCNCGAKFILRVPRKVVIERLETSNGALRAENIDGGARMRTSNGSVKLWRVNGDVEATTSNGTIEVSEYSGAARLKTSNGRVKGDGIRGSFSADTSNGSIDVTIAELDAGRALNLGSSNGTVTLAVEKYNGNPITVHTSNSSINVRLPEGVNADVRASTSNGSISSDFDVVTRTSSKNRMDGRLGNGGALLDLTTSNGTVRLLRR